MGSETGMVLIYVLFVYIYIYTGADPGGGALGAEAPPSYLGFT